MFLSNGGVVRTGEVGYRPRQLCGPDRATKRAPLEILPVGVQRLGLICPAKEVPGKASEEVPAEAPAEAAAGFPGEALEEVPAKASEAAEEIPAENE